MFIFEVISIVNLILTLIMFPLIIIMLVEYRSFNKSTHRIEYQPVPLPPQGQDTDLGMTEKEFLKAMEPDDEFME